MCGRYEFHLSDSHKSDTIKAQATKMNLVYKQGEIFPGDKVLCMVPFMGMINLDTKKWGIESKTLLINARKETLIQKPTFFKIINNRCAVIANGFYEWNQKDKYYISTNDEYIYLAAIYNDKNELVIITKPSQKEMSKIHEREPIIMNQKEMLDYLNFTIHDASYKDLNITKIDK